MKATVVDLRYKMNDVLKALDRNERVTVFFRGRIKGILIPSQQKKQGAITDHPFFGMSAQDQEETVTEQVTEQVMEQVTEQVMEQVMEQLDELRKPRYDAV